MARGDLKGMNTALDPESKGTWIQRLTYYNHEGMELISTVGACLCEDGKLRLARTRTGIPDTFSSIPATVIANGKTVAGFITTDWEYDLATNDCYTIWKFIAYKYRKNWREVAGD